MTKMKSAIGRFLERLLRRRYGERCGFDEPYVSACRNGRPCGTHQAIKCRRCDAPATRRCSYPTALVCGHPLCDDCPCIIERHREYRRACQRCTRGHATIKGWLCLDSDPCSPQPVTHSIAIAQAGRDA